ncbi:Uncharacterized protein APZ42_024662 [Daphnia magna]|uniref:Uncharacterized protein n=1 Tax=Daphnia magna TaxID=35525 RepID=A0A164TV73_9CRUS|nr:Uncharacterized protein APZ42_024662 [Daphnia magna]
MVSCSVLRRQDHSSLLTETSRVRPVPLDQYEILFIKVCYHIREQGYRNYVLALDCIIHQQHCSKLTVPNAPLPKSRSPFATKLPRVSKPTKFIKLKKDNPVDWNHSPDVGHTGSYPYVCP